MNSLTNPRMAGLAGFFAVMYLVQSLGDPSSGIMAQPIRGFLKGDGASAQEIAFFMGIVGLPWAMKPVFGLLSDFVPIFGSRRRVYLILATLGAAVGTASLAGLPVVESSRGLMLALLLLTAIGVAFGDVLIDGLMITTGQPARMTGVLQSVQWTAAYAGLLATGFIGGFFSQINRPDLAFGLCSLLWGASLLMAIFMVRDTRLQSPVDTAQLKIAFREIVSAKGLLPVAAFLFIWTFNPLWTSVLYLHLTETLGRSEVEFGQFLSIFSFGAMIGSATYPLYCRRLSMGILIKIAIGVGIAGNLLYLLMIAPSYRMELSIGFLTGATYMIGTMIQLDIAARSTPLVAAATIFALLMALTNLSSSTSEAIGGALYQYYMDAGAIEAYSVVVLGSAAAPAMCWFLIPWLRRELPEWFT